MTTLLRPLLELAYQYPFIICALGYNDFNNLVMQTLWWLPNKILRHIHNKRFPFFEPFPAHLQSKLTKSANKSKKVFLIKKIQYMCQKTQNFTLISNPFKKFWNNAPKKIILANDGNMHFFTFTHVRQTCFAYNFFGAFFNNLFQRIRSQREILRFLISFF